jgi:hypothetical protein
MTRADWMLRPILWFTTASTINVLLHEGAHAVTARAFGIQPTLFQYWVNWDSPATAAQRAVIGAAGPFFSLMFGLLCWLAYRRRSQSAAGLPLLDLSAGGISIFFGNLLSTAFVGDFSNAASALSLPTPARYAASLTGALASAAILFWQGRELRQWIPRQAGRRFGVIGITVVPIVIGTALIILINQPVPPELSFASARMSEASIGIFAVLGAATGQQPSTAGRSFRLWWIDGTCAIAALLAVRIAARGIPFAP